MIFHVEFHTASANDSAVLETGKDVVIRCVFSGHFFQSIEDALYLISANEIFFIKPQTRGEFTALCDTEYADLHVPAELMSLLKEPETFPAILETTPEKQQAVSLFLKSLKSRAQERCIDSPAQSVKEFAELMIMILQNANDITERQRRMGEAVLFIHSNYQRDITLHDLAAVAECSISHFRRQFKQLMNQSPIDYLLNVRLAKATELLKDHSRSISSIAAETGFNDANYLSRAFSGKYGVPPRQWRNGSSQK